MPIILSAPSQLVVTDQSTTPSTFVEQPVGVYGEWADIQKRLGEELRLDYQRLVDELCKGYQKQIDQLGSDLLAVKQDIVVLEADRMERQRNRDNGTHLFVNGKERKMGKKSQYMLDMLTLAND
jgi:hypothetical protein